jgi:hypothetical protein
MDSLYVNMSRYVKYVTLLSFAMQQYLLSVYCVPGSVLGTWESSMNKTKILPMWTLCAEVGKWM